MTRRMFFKGFGAFLLISVWMGLVCAYVIHVCYWLPFTSFPITFILLQMGLVVWLFAIIGLRELITPLRDNFRFFVRRRQQTNLRRSAIIILSLHSSRIMISIILLFLSFIFPLNPLIFIIFIICMEGIDADWDTAFVMNFPEDERKAWISLDDYTDNATRWIFYLPYLLTNLWIVFFFLLQLITITISLAKHELRWIKMIAPDLNIGIFFLFFLPFLFPFAFLFCFVGYIYLYVPHLFPDWFPPERNKIRMLV